MSFNESDRFDQLSSAQLSQLSPLWSPKYIKRRYRKIKYSSLTHSRTRALPLLLAFMYTYFFINFALMR